MTPQRTYLDNLQDILTAATDAVRFTAGVDLDTFRTNTEKIYAVTRALEIIGEAARQIPPSVRAAYPDIPWQEMVGMRNIVIHQYFGVDAAVLWATVREDLPPLAVELAAILPSL